MWIPEKPPYRKAEYPQASGQRLLHDAESTPFDNVDEAADFPEMDEPEFLPIEYKVKKKGGILKMTAELLEDTASNIMAYINKWIAKKTRGTANNTGLSAFSCLCERTWGNGTVQPLISGEQRLQRSY